MLVYLDTNVVQDCADFVIGDKETHNLPENHQTETAALKYLFELAHMVDLEFEYLEGAYSPQLDLELFGKRKVGEPTNEQRETYQALREAWEDGPYCKECLVPSTLLRREKDQRHWLSARALGAEFLLTRDSDFDEEHSRDETPPRVLLPTQFVEEICKPGGYLTGLFLR